MKKTLIQKKGITLIALVVTIIVLLLLAGISVMMLTGNNGILQRAGEAREKTDKKQIIEEAQLDILAQQATKLSGDLTETELEGILSPKFGTLSTEEERTIDKKLTTKDGKYEINVSEIYNGKLLIVQKISFTVRDQSFIAKDGQNWYDWATDTSNSDDLEIGECNGINMTLKSLIIQSYENNYISYVYRNSNFYNRLESIEFYDENYNLQHCDDAIIAGKSYIIERFAW